MKKVLLVLVLCLTWTASVWAHGDISKLPNTVQITQYKLQLFISPDDLDARNKLALAYYRTNKLDDAESNLKQVLEADNKNFDAHDAMGLVLLKRNKPQEALESFKKAAKLNEQDMMIHAHISVAYEKLNKPADAENERNKAQSLASSPEAQKSVTDEIKLVGGR